MKAAEALALIEPIPEDKFISSSFTNGVDCCCVMGHLMRLTSDNPNDYSYANCNEFAKHPLVVSDDNVMRMGNLLRQNSADFVKKKYDLNYDDIASVNNGDNINGYNEPKIKDRVIHFLKDMVEAGY